MHHESLCKLNESLCMLNESLCMLNQTVNHFCTYEYEATHGIIRSSSLYIQKRFNCLGLQAMDSHTRQCKVACKHKNMHVCATT